MACNAVGPGLALAENDVIWSSPDTWPGAAFTYFQIEVQSTVKQNMAMRILRYMVLHGFQLWSDYAPPLPVVVSVMLYAGESPWNPAET